MILTVKFLPQAVDDLNKLDNCDKRYILTSIEKLTANRRADTLKSYGKSLDNIRDDLFYVKLMGMDIRIVYQLIPYGTDYILLFVEFAKATSHGNITLKKTRKNK